MDVTLSTGKKITVDVTGLTVKDWRDFTTKRGTIKDENAVISKCTGLKPEEIETLDYQDFRKITVAIVRAANEPSPDPN